MVSSLVTDPVAGFALISGDFSFVAAPSRAGLATYRVDWERWSAKSAGDSLDRLVLAIAPANPVNAETTVARARGLAADPVYQLK